jgi:peptidoglycan/xylan/chitin deacetylase (PgdA/CDA1 family)
MSFIKRSVIKGLSQRVLVNYRQRFVFVYHDISGPEAPHYSELYSTPLEVFRQQLELLAKNFTVVSVEDILSPDLNGHKKRLAAITFDDGFLSVRDAAFPLLKEKGIPFAIFLNRMAITENRLFNGSENGKLEQSSAQKIFLNEDDVKFLSEQGVVIGSHTATHRSLVHCDEEALREQVDGNKFYLEQLLGLPVRHLALPFGKREHYDDKVLDHCFRSGHDHIYSSNPTFFDPSSQRRQQKRLIPRIGLTNQTPEEMAFLINRPLFKRIDI